MEGYFNGHVCAVSEYSRHEETLIGRGIGRQWHVYVHVDQEGRWQRYPGSRFACAAVRYRVVAVHVAVQPFVCVV